MRNRLSENFSNKYVGLSSGKQIWQWTWWHDMTWSILNGYIVYTCWGLHQISWRVLGGTRSVCIHLPFCRSWRPESLELLAFPQQMRPPAATIMDLPSPVPTWSLRHWDMVLKVKHLWWAVTARMIWSHMTWPISSSSTEMGVGYSESLSLQ